MNINNFQHQYIRDLVWLLTTPALAHCTAESWQIPAADPDTLAFIDQELIKGALRDKPFITDLPSGSPLLPFAQNNPPRRLGLYVEQLWGYWLRLHPEIEVLMSNRVIHHQKKTLGEFDIILRDFRDQKIWHLELAIKFYLRTPDAWGAPWRWSHWLGPGCIDSLDHKWHKLYQQQLTLSHRPEVQALLHGEACLPDHSSSLTRGILFYPDTADPLLISSANNHKISPVRINSAHQRGIWQTFRHWVDCQPETSDWYIMRKPHWLALPAQPEWQNKRQIMSEIDHELQREHPVYIAHRQSEQRYFIVPDHWPHQQPLPWHYPDKRRLDEDQTEYL
ncbi:DUF1853 family protein [Oceanospirillum sediminis]|uniref:DUF1853 family protein n=1 Tax=Oceanospirillum sediminis TaxID=2760088 RepID=A0A839IKA4_9GAMM|nr:DUF1853 family protein [Oceanospirillum sediminis]MBB1485368.1 DUF1853 family protein [Oceanospirillum sediminis]